MLRRTLTGATLLVLTVGAWWFDRSQAGAPAWALGALGVILTLGALDELLRMGGAAGPRRHVGLAAGVLWLAALVLAGATGGAALTAAGDVLTAASAIAGLALVLRLAHGPGEAVVRLAGSLWFVVPYVGGLGCMIALLMAGRVDFVVGIVLVAKSSDIGAYFAGKSFGRRKLAPTISPGKTVEGAVGGLILPGIVAAFLLDGVSVGDTGGSAEVTLPGGLAGAVVHGVALGVLAIVSDLAESLLKRSCEVKDSGTLFGESGGFLDLADSLLLVGPFALAYTALLA